MAKNTSSSPLAERAKGRRTCRLGISERPPASSASCTIRDASSSRFRLKRALGRYSAASGNTTKLSNSAFFGTAFVIVALTTTPVDAQSMVMVMRSDGSLEAQSPQSGFSRTYGNARRSDRDSIFLFNEDEEEESAVSAPEAAAHVSRAVPPPAVLKAIDATAMRYGSHPALRRVGMSVTEWRRLFQANIEIESAYDTNARSHVGAIGLGQLMPATASILRVNPHDWRENLDGSARYLLTMLAQFQDPRLALAAYNAGPGAVVENGGMPPYRETRNHVLKVMGVFARLQGEFG